MIKLRYTCFVHYIYTHTRRKHTKQANAGFKIFISIRKLDDYLKKRKKKNRGWKVKLRKKWKIRKIVVRFEPRTLAAGQATPNYFAYTSPVKIPGSSVSWITPPPTSPICHPHKHTSSFPTFRLLSRFSPFPFSTIYVIFLAKVYRPSSRIFLFRAPPFRPTLRKLCVKKCKMFEILLASRRKREFLDPRKELLRDPRYYNSTSFFFISLLAISKKDVLRG